jgi:hypothetical protein
MATDRLLRLAQHCTYVIFALVSACVPPSIEKVDDPKQDIPTTGHDDIEAWLATKAYQSWKCELRPHPPRDPSPHKGNRVCINRIGDLGGRGEMPVDTGLVKEFLDANNQIIGYSTERHTRAGAGGDSWYWYERVPLYWDDPNAPHDERGVIADGWGFDSAAKDICVKCHATAGFEGHSGHDLVFTFP